ncbi:type II toxin-antitoxin system HicA family toxin [Phormidesmis sp. 146-12]
MRLPRDLSGDDLVKSLTKFGYVVTRQTGSHTLNLIEKNFVMHFSPNSIGQANW